MHILIHLWFLHQKNIWQVTQLTIKQALVFFHDLKLSAQERIVSYQVLKEINQKLKFCLDVGLDYLSLPVRN